jgi:hypothetical protein
MDKPTDAPDRETPPPPEILRTREQLIESRFGRWGRLRSLATILVGLLVLAVLYMVMGQTE